MPFDKIVVVTKKTPLEELIERYNTREQAQFYIEHMGASFAEYEKGHAAYASALAGIKAALPGGVRHQIIERSFLPTFSFGDQDLVVSVGPDGLVVNIAKYLKQQLLLALNPDPQRIDGILVPFPAAECAAVLQHIGRGRFKASHISMARAQLNDGQTLYAVNDLFIGQRTHVSARYSLQLGTVRENQSSSGIIVSTGAGSTGWFRSVLAGASGVVANFAPGEEVAQSAPAQPPPASRVAAARAAAKEARPAAVQFGAKRAKLTAAQIAAAVRAEQIAAAKAAAPAEPPAAAQFAVAKGKYRFSWEADFLYYNVREPFESKVSSAALVFGRIEPGQKLRIVSQMPQNGVIFSDGIENDYLEFNSGAIAEIGLAKRKVNLITGIG